VEYHRSRVARRRAAWQAGGLEAIMFGSLGLPEILLILLIVILIFGTSRIPELGRGLGEGIKNFRKAVKGQEEEEKKP
jgi:sec-independent protein translocase protein TatA